jgi:CO/xanthine dehydrogenase FAD-binding subunit
LTGVTYEAPANMEELLEALDKQPVTILAGATDILPRINEGSLVPSRLVYIGRAGLEGIRPEPGRIVIGAATRLAEILESREVAAHAPLLARAIGDMAGVSIRNIATIGGNLCNASPAADTAVPLLALGAKLVALSKNGKRIIPLDEFFIGPGKTSLTAREVLAEIVIDSEPHGGAFLKIGQRKAETLAVISAAAKVVVENRVCSRALIAMGSVAPRPVRCYEAERLLTGQRVSGELCRRAAAAAGGYADPIDDGRATAWYRRRVAPVLVERALRKAFGLEECDCREVCD